MKCQQQSTLSPTPIPSSPSILISGGKRHNILPCCSPNTFTVPLVKFTFLLSHISFSCQSPSLYLTTLYNSSQSLSSLSSPLRISSLCVSFFSLYIYNPLHFSLFPHFPLQLSSQICRFGVPPLDLAAPSLFPCPLWSLRRPSFSGSVWCVSLWSFCAIVHPVDRKHPVHHHSQLPVGSAGSAWPICVIFCQITGVWLCMIRPSPNHLPGERGREAGERKVQVGQQALH